jgi:hypothetical protein
MARYEVMAKRPGRTEEQKRLTMRFIGPHDQDRPRGWSGAKAATKPRDPPLKTRISIARRRGYVKAFVANLVSPAKTSADATVKTLQGREAPIATVTANQFRRRRDGRHCRGRSAQNTTKNKKVPTVELTVGLIL